jgi:N-acetylneuraminic acid mutarotase
MLRTRARFFAIVSSLFAAGPLAGCSDAIHLDPGSGGSTATHMTGTAGGGGSQIGCTSNADCPYPTPVCNTEVGHCAECLVVDDCAAKPGTVCSKAACVCPEKDATFCAAEAPASGTCVDLKTASTDCGTCGHGCFGACVNGKCADPWEETSNVDAPAPRVWHTAVWTGSVMIVWGGLGGAGPLGDGASYDPKKRTWTAIDSVGAPSPRYRHSAVWDASRGTMLVFGGTDGAREVESAGAYDVAKNHWTTLSTSGEPGPRQLHGATMVGTKMFIWGGESAGNAIGDGALYDPDQDAWSPLPTDAAPTARRQHIAISNGAKVVVWGGFGDDGALMMPNQYLSDGAVYDTNATSWSPTSSGPLSARGLSSAVTANGKVFIFGGKAGADPFPDGAAYGSDDSWGSFIGANPDARAFHTAVFTGTGNKGQMVVWGGQGIGSVYLATGAGVSVSNLQWASVIPQAPQGRLGHTAVSTGTAMIVWGGQVGGGGLTSTGGVFDASP